MGLDFQTTANDPLQETRSMLSVQILEEKSNITIIEGANTLLISLARARLSRGKVWHTGRPSSLA